MAANIILEKNDIFREFFVIMANKQMLETVQVQCDLPIYLPVAKGNVEKVAKLGT